MVELAAAIFIFMAIFLGVSKRTYSYSYAFPLHIRCSWIRMVHLNDYLQWDTYKSILQSEFAFYKLLNEKEKNEFLVRLTDIKNQIPFEGREGLDIDQRKHILLCASLSQITFGFWDFRLHSFEKIIIYPEVFYSKFLNSDVKGVTYGTGYIYLSWADFEDGYVNFKNKLNLGLHEFAHALMIEKKNLLSGNQIWRMEKMMQFLINQQEAAGIPDPLFRKYGFTNFAEFWAVCVEVFFEQPIQFKETYVNLYRIVSDALQQDMATRLQNYKTWKMSSLG